jgi:structure-specific recognition protein 1
LSSVKCSYKTSEGFLYPLERSLIFIDKPVIYIPLEDIIKVDFMRFKKSSVQKSFDITIISRKEQNKFSGIDKNDFDDLVNYFKNKNVKIGSEDGEDNIDFHQSVRYII